MRHHFAQLRRLLAAVALLGAAALPQAHAAHAADGVPSLAGCRSMVPSPAFATDGTAFCVAVFPTSQTTTTVKLYVTHDHGRTWATTLPTGFGNVFPDISQFLISPDFSTDHMLVLKFAGDQVYYSLDAGNTFAQAPLPFGSGRLTLVHSAVAALPASVVSTAVLQHAAILAAVSGGSPGQNDSYLFDPVVPSIRPVGGTADLDEAFFPSPDYVNDHTAFAAGWLGNSPPTAHAELFSCTPTFSCPTKTYAFSDPNTWVDQLQYAPDYAQSGTLLLTLTNGITDHYQVLVSHDRGAHFTAVAPVQQALGRLYAAGGAGTVAIATGPSGTTSLFAYLTGGDGRKHGPPTDQLFRSDDDGHSWKLVAYSRCLCPAHGPGTLPYGNIYGSRANAVTPSGLLTRAGHTMMLTSEWIPPIGPPLLTVWCSSDLGRTWAVPCH